TSLAAEQIAYIGFHPCKAKPHVAPAVPLERLLIHVRGGKVFAVEVSPQSIASNLGFRGRPTAAGSPFQSIFFYRHGVNAHEKDVRLGELLVKSGAMPVETLQLGIDAQSQNRNVPIGQVLVEQGEVPSEAVDTAVLLQARRKMRLGQMLIEAGVATQAVIDRAIAEQKQRKGKRLGQVLI